MRAWFRCSIAEWNWRDTFKPFETIFSSGRRMILSTPFYRELKKPRIIASFLWAKINEEASNARWTVVSSGQCASGRIDFRSLMKLKQEQAGISGLTEFVQDPTIEAKETTIIERTDRPLSLLAKIWSSMTQEIVIPFDLDARKERFASIYKDLEPLVTYYERLKKEKKTRAGDSMSRL